MIPVTNQLKEVDMMTIPSKDYRMGEEHVAGICEDLEEIRQAVLCILSTERYQYPIYTWNYGIELKDLLGKPMDYVLSELQRRIEEALTQDDRIDSVDGFEFEVNGRSVEVMFTVYTTSGNIYMEKRWDYV